MGLKVLVDYEVKIQDIPEQGVKSISNFHPGILTIHTNEIFINYRTLSEHNGTYLFYDSSTSYTQLSLMGTLHCRSG